MKSIVCSLLALGLLLFAPAGARAAASPTPKPKPKHMVVSAVSGSSITTDTGFIKKEYKLNDQTVYNHEGIRVKRDEVKVGMRVVVTPAFDGKTAAVVSVTNPPPVVATASPAAAPKK